MPPVQGEGTVEADRAVARGTLSQRPLPRLIQQLFRKRVTGCLQIQDDSNDESCVYLRDGAPVHVVRPNDLDRLDRVLVESGTVAAVHVAQALDVKSRTDKRLGDILLEAGHLSAESLATALRLQLRRKLTRLFFAREGTFAIFTEPHAYGEGPEFAAMRVDPRVVLYQGIRAAYDGARLQEELKPLAGRTFRLVPAGHGLTEAMGLSAKDPVIAALQSRPVRLEELGTLATKVAEARAGILALLYADLLDSEEASPPEPADIEVSAPFVPPPAAVVAQPPVAAPATDPALRARIEDLASRLNQLSHFEVLDVPDTATPAEVTAAYLKAVRQLHPDKLLGAGLVGLAKQTERILARMSEASAILGDARKRAEYTDSRSGKAAAPDPAWLIVEAEQTFKKGEAFLKRGDFARAAEAFAEARDKNPDEPEYRAYWAWARFETPGAAKGTLARETLSIFDDVLRTKEKFVLARYWSGQIWKFLGEIPKAEKSFRDTIELDSNFIDAERELRLIAMRRERSSKFGAPRTPETARTGGGLLDKFFKR